MIYISQNNTEFILGVWKLDESQEVLLSMLDIDDSIEDILLINSEKRVLEMLAVRVLIKELLGEQKQINYYGSGRPHLDDNSYCIGISHTKGYVAVGLHPNKKVGIDIEAISDKVKRVESRLITEAEYIDRSQELVHLLLHFSIKEALFKVLDEKGVDFLSHLHVSHFTPQTAGICKAMEVKTPSKQKFDEVHYRVDDDFVLVWLIQ